MTVDRGLRALVLDDEAHRHDWFRKQADECGWFLVQAWNVLEAIQALREGERFDVVFLDYDLADPVRGIAGPPGGIVARYIEHMGPGKLPKHVHIHSWNPDGADEMEAAMKRAGLKHSRAEFGKFKLVAREGRAA
jgi:hypothetical protein